MPYDTSVLFEEWLENAGKRLVFISMLTEQPK